MAITLNGDTGIISPDFEPSGSTVPANGMYLPTTNTLAWATNSTERLRLDASGNLGLGVTPSAWGSGFKAIDIGTVTGVIDQSGVTAVLAQNAYYNSGWKYKATTGSRVSRYDQYDGAHYWHIGPSGTAGAAISFTQAMTLDAGGNLLVGNTNAGGSNGSSIVIGPTTTSAGVSVSAIYGNSSTTTVNSQTYNLTFNSSAKVFSVALASGDACLVVTNYLTTTITIVGTTTNIVASASPTANQLGISKSAASHVITFKTGSSAATAFGSWSIQSLTSTVA